MLNRCKLLKPISEATFLILAVEINMYISNEIKRAGMPDNMQGCIWLFLAILYKQAMVNTAKKML